MGEDVLRDTHDVATPTEPLQGEKGGSLLLNRDPSGEAGAKNGAAGFGNRQGGRNALSWGPNGRFRGHIAFEHGCDQRAGFDVASGRRAGRFNGLTFRHGRYRSGRLPYPEGAESPGSLPGDRRSRWAG